MLCPLHLHALTELKKQSIDDKRRLTAAIMDRLSHGLTLIAPPERVTLEVLRLVQSLALHKERILPPRDEVWTKPAFILGSPSFPRKGVSAQAHDWASRMAEGELWSMSLAQIEAHFPESSETVLGSQVKTINELNSRKRENRAQFTTYKQLYRNELVGLLDVFDEEIADVGLLMFAAAGGNMTTVTAEERRESARGWRNAVLIMSDQRGIEQAFPTAHVMTSMYARMDWDTMRQYRVNDSADFWHAASALPYCDAFMTERNLQGLLAQAHLPEVYGCEVVSSYDSLQRWLDGKSHAANDT